MRRRVLVLAAVAILGNGGVAVAKPKPLPAGVPVQVLHVRRYDVDIVPAPDLMLEIGDRIGVLVPTEHIAATRAHFGDTVKAAAEVRASGPKRRRRDGQGQQQVDYDDDGEQRHDGTSQRRTHRQRRWWRILKAVIDMMNAVTVRGSRSVCTRSKKVMNTSCDRSSSSEMGPSARMSSRRTVGPNRYQASRVQRGSPRRSPRTSASSSA